MLTITISIWSTLRNLVLRNPFKIYENDENFKWTVLARQNEFSGQSLQGFRDLAKFSSHFLILVVLCYKIVLVVHSI